MDSDTAATSITGKPITGPELATLLEILVTAANEGSLAEVSWYTAATDSDLYQTL